MVDFIYSRKNPEAPLAYCEIMAMHSRLELLFVCEDREKAEALCKESEATVLELDRIFDRHRDGSGISELNAADDFVATEDDLFFALELCEQFRKSTHGYFDIAACSPDGSRAAVPAGQTAYILKPATHEAKRSAPGIILDFGGFAKGYALEKIRKKFMDEGIVNALLNFGDSSVVGIGTHPLGPCWKICSHEGGRVFQLRDSALSVSGMSRKGTGHIIDPHTERLVEEDEEIAVSGKSALVCEMLSTALYAAPKTERKSIMTLFEDYKYE